MWMWYLSTFNVSGRSAGGSGQGRSSLGTTTMRWAAWRARSFSAAVGPPNAEEDYYERDTLVFPSHPVCVPIISIQPHIYCTWLYWSLLYCFSLVEPSILLLYCRIFLLLYPRSQFYIILSLRNVWISIKKSFSPRDNASANRLLFSFFCWCESTNERVSLVIYPEIQLCGRFFASLTASFLGITFTLDHDRLPHSWDPC